MGLSEQTLMKRVHKISNGFTLIEILVFLSIFSVSIILVISTVAYGSLQMNQATNKIKATHYNEEIAEWLKFQRNVNGYSEISSRSGTYCFNSDIIIDSWPANTACAQNDFSFRDFFKRELVIDRVGTETNCQITTQWIFLDINNPQAVVLNINFNEYEL